MSSRNVLRIVGLVVAAGVTTLIGYNVAMYSQAKATPNWQLIAGIAALVGLIFLVITPWVVIPPYHKIRDLIRHAAVSDLIAGAIGLIVGLLIAALANIFLSQIQFLHLGQWLPILVAILMAYIGIAVAVVRKEDFGRLIASAFGTSRAARRAAREERESAEEAEEHEERPGRLRERLAGRGKGARPTDRILVDTSAIIDGRIADIADTGFIAGTLVVPRFVLEELQHIADSADSLRRNRGRRGLEILQRLQKDSLVQVEITDADPENTPEVDAKLVKLGRQWHGSIITNDFNLNRVAELQGVKVLNINELAHAVKPIVLPGEDMTIKIMQEGKELGQGVGYLDDGTMIVVEGGRTLMGATVDVTVTRVLQTVAGRMIFAHPKQQPAGSAASARRAGTA
ncbi:MAG: PIN/TRAM domain-containing protein [Ktedonobacterales bacterium]